ncbi:hypothetical protein MC885_000595 [Smutsia gigantea]|nr:hypothetical protein MC885_000595 [Smutsia gigantea]
MSQRCRVPFSGPASVRGRSVSSLEVDKPSWAGFIMLQQLLITLPSEAGTWVKLRHPKKAEEEAPLWEDVTKMFEGAALLSQAADETQRESFKDEVTSGPLKAESQVCWNLKSKIETNVSTAKNDNLQEQLYHGIMMERFMRDDVIYPTMREVSEYDDELERHQETHGRHVRQAILNHKKRGLETNKFGGNFDSKFQELI